MSKTPCRGNCGSGQGVIVLNNLLDKAYGN
jgi:hypothetical protein